ncbi:Rmi1p KNAG_0A02360 [Huiozyma naganishii CBS 8797]|uniref:RecQ mediated genome instability protein 1 OB-fold domain-containing protein n=1 Tax=Huiozyma naganishii (strain ATCC MYA-139 / BCRC 22969 / CBS 8797 / KCTC 17520 / NBRC 10181 / NCYC 3082 / Yp74L-3) TaxID=1071383 RepID=J7QZL4_HUIN7|nr:hypothetical protein KNAG_0A02360 [Kazachstania naganishii CBS 8797]CCK67925.1 hypothetical protein KNAG_0A02360 [Kazachstania naganishii CBS 8797]
MLVSFDNFRQDITADCSTCAASGDRELSAVRAWRNEPWVPTQGKRVVDRELLFQILLVENVSKPKQAQLDAIRAKLDPRNQRVDTLRGGSTPRRQAVVTQVDLDNDDVGRGAPALGTAAGANNNKSVFKFTLQDKSGAVFFGINRTPLLHHNSWILGAKLILKPGTIVNNDVFLFQKEQAVFLGGIDRVWNENNDLKMRDYLEYKLNRDNCSAAGNKKKRKFTSIQ